MRYHLIILSRLILAGLILVVLAFTTGCSSNDTAKSEEYSAEQDNAIKSYLAGFDRDRLAKTDPHGIWEDYLKTSNTAFSETGVDDYMRNYYYPYTKNILAASSTYSRDYNYLYTILSNYNRYMARAAGGGTGFGHYEERLPGEINWLILSTTMKEQNIPVTPLTEKIKEKWGIEPSVAYDNNIFSSQAEYEKTKVGERKEMEEELSLIKLNLEKLQADNPDLYHKTAGYIVDYN